MPLANRLREQRISLGMTQEEVARKSGMHQTQYNAYECGRNRPNMSTLGKLASVLRTTMEALTVDDGASEAVARLGAQSLDEMLDALRKRIAEHLHRPLEKVVVKVELT